VATWNDADMVHRADLPTADALDAAREAKQAADALRAARAANAHADDEDDGARSGERVAEGADETSARNHAVTWRWFPQSTIPLLLCVRLHLGPM